MDLNALYNESFEAPKHKQELNKIYNIEQSYVEEEQLLGAGVKFSVTRTASTARIKAFYEHKTVVNWYLERTKSMGFLIYLNKIKKEMEEREEVIVSCQVSSEFIDVNYFKFSKNINEINKDSGSVYELKNVYEADISHAYYRAAYVLGFISKKLYLDILKNVSKHDRLRLLGCIATVKTFAEYDNGKLTVKPVIINNELLRAAWFKICNYIDNALMELRAVLKSDFLFYWVDGIFFKYKQTHDDIETAEFWHKIRRIKYKYDVEFKTEALKQFNLINKGEYLEIEIVKQNGDVKRFFPPKEKVRTYSIVDLNSDNEQENNLTFLYDEKK